MATENSRRPGMNCRRVDRNRAHFFFEVYVKGPNGETGWEIKVGFVLYAGVREEAVRRLKLWFGSRFDEVIQCHESALFDIKGSRSFV